MKIIEKTYVIIFLFVIFASEKLYMSLTTTRNNHFIVEFIFLFLAGILLGFDKQILLNKRIYFNKWRFLYTFVPVLLVAAIAFIDFLMYLGIFLPLPEFTIAIRFNIAYKQICLVLLGYFLITSFSFKEKQPESAG